MELISFIIALIFLVCMYFVGSYIEKLHYDSIHEREDKLANLPVVTFDKSYELSNIDKVDLVIGSAVISLDHFKRFLASLQALVGGRMSSYESLVDRARREAVLRMQEAAPGAEIILNVRIETSSIGSTAQQKQSVGSIEAIAYGTAIWK